MTDVPFGANSDAIGGAQPPVTSSDVVNRSDEHLGSQIAIGENLILSKGTPAQEGPLRLR